jgi:hypothetical protein
MLPFYHSKSSVRRGLCNRLIGRRKMKEFEPTLPIGDPEEEAKLSQAEANAFWEAQEVFPTCVGVNRLLISN